MEAEKGRRSHSRARPNRPQGSIPARFKAVFRKGVLVPERPLGLDEGAEVELSIEASRLIPPAVIDPEERKRILKEIVRRMAENPIPEDAPRFTRDELHERG